MIFRDFFFLNKEIWASEKLMYLSLKLRWQPNTEHSQCEPVKDMLIMMTYSEELKIQEQNMKRKRTINITLKDTVLGFHSISKNY